MDGSAAAPPLLCSVRTLRMGRNTCQSAGTCHGLNALNFLPAFTAQFRLEFNFNGFGGLLNLFLFDYSLKIYRWLKPHASSSYEVDWSVTTIWKHQEKLDRLLA